jgi:hypothetical protein
MANLLGDVWALWLHAAGMEVPNALWGIVVLLAITALLLYPRRRGIKSAGYSYALHKACDLVLCLSTIAIVAFATNGAIKTITPANASIVWHREAPASHKNVSTATAGKSRGLTRILQSVKRWYQEMPVWAKVLLMTLTIVVTVVLGLFWAAVCCEISCSGAEALAAVLLVLGWGGLATAAFFVCGRIVRGPRFRGPRVRAKEDTI